MWLAVPTQKAGGIPTQPVDTRLVCTFLGSGGGEGDDGGEGGTEMATYPPLPGGSPRRERGAPKVSAKWHHPGLSRGGGGVLALPELGFPCTIAVESCRPQNCHAQRSVGPSERIALTRPQMRAVGPHTWLWEEGGACGGGGGSVSDSAVRVPLLSHYTGRGGGVLQRGRCLPPFLWGWGPVPPEPLPSPTALNRRPRRQPRLPARPRPPSAPPFLKAGLEVGPGGGSSQSLPPPKEHNPAAAYRVIGHRSTFHSGIALDRRVRRWPRCIGCGSSPSIGVRAGLSLRRKTLCKAVAIDAGDQRANHGPQGSRAYLCRAQPWPTEVHGMHLLGRLATNVRQLRHDQMGQGPTEPHAGRSTFLLSSGGAGAGITEWPLVRGGLRLRPTFPAGR